MEDHSLMETAIDQQREETFPAGGENGQVDTPLSVQPEVEVPPKVEEPQVSDVILPGIQALLSAMAELRQDFDTKVKYDESKELIINSLHKELQVQREGLHFRVLRPLILDLIALYDEFGTFIERMLVDPKPELQPIARNLQAFQELIEEMLERNGVETFSVEQDIFMASRQRNVRIHATTEPAQDKQIVRRVRKGFVYEGKQLRPEIVETYKYSNHAAQ